MFKTSYHIENICTVHGSLVPGVRVYGNTLQDVFPLSLKSFFWPPRNYFQALNFILEWKGKANFIFKGQGHFHSAKGTSFGIFLKSIGNFSWGTKVNSRATKTITLVAPVFYGVDVFRGYSINAYDILSTLNSLLIGRVPKTNHSKLHLRQGVIWKISPQKKPPEFL